VVVAADYAGVVRTCLLAYKERGRRDLTRPLAVALAAAVAEFGHGPVWLISIPSADAVARRRGGQHVERLARHAVRILRRSRLSRSWPWPPTGRIPLSSPPPSGGSLRRASSSLDPSESDRPGRPGW
jgi:hypothetical protein